ncbi:MAG: SgcJ/EcaC family oxidoreductase [Thermoanaerobaculia bacterium]|nr:SgcJ/EcaC family oxidoreductase [Thermoanaerobaculia bacterium]
MRRTTAAICSSLFIAAPLATAQKPDCSVRPPRNTDPAELRRLAKISSKDAEARAILSVAPNKVNAVMSSGVEVVNGCLAYPFDLRFANKGGVQEVMVDAGDGKILSSEYEPPAGGAASGATGAAAPEIPPPAVTATPAGTPPAALPPGVLPVTDPAAAAEEASIRKVIDAEEDAWNRGDAKAFAARFQEEGSFTDVFGAVSRSRAELEKRQVEFFASLFKGSRLALKVRRVRFLRPDVAIVEIDTEVTGFKKLPPVVYVDAEKTLRTRLQQVMVKSGPDWMVAAFHNVDVKTPPETLVNPEDPAHARRW